MKLVHKNGAVDLTSNKIIINPISANQLNPSVVNEDVNKAFQGLEDYLRGQTTNPGDMIPYSVEKGKTVLNVVYKGDGRRDLIQDFKGFNNTVVKKESLNAIAKGFEGVRDYLEETNQTNAHIELPVFAVDDKVDFKKTQEVIREMIGDLDVSVEVKHPENDADKFLNIGELNPMKGMTFNDKHVFVDSSFVLLEDSPKRAFRHDGHKMTSFDQALSYEKAKLFDDIVAGKDILQGKKVADNQIVGFDSNKWNEVADDKIVDIYKDKLTTSFTGRSFVDSIGERTLVFASPDKEAGIGMSIQKALQLDNEGRLPFTDRGSLNNKKGEHFAENKVGQALTKAVVLSKEMKETVKASEDEFKMAVTGHRPKDMKGGYKHLQTEEGQALQREFEDIIRNGLNKHDKVRVISGMADGADMMWANAAIALKNEFPYRIQLEAHVPADSQDSLKTEKGSAYYRSRLQFVDRKQVMLGSLVPESGAYVKALQDRNVTMIDRSDVLVAAYNGTSVSKSGTFNAINSAIDKQHPIHFVKTREAFEHFVPLGQEVDKRVRDLLDGGQDITAKRYEDIFDTQVSSLASELEIEDGVRVGLSDFGNQAFASLMEEIEKNQQSLEDHPEEALVPELQDDFFAQLDAMDELQR